MTTNHQETYREGFCSGVQVGIDKLQLVLAVYRGYPKNKLTALDVKELLETELGMLRGTVKINSRA